MVYRRRPENESSRQSSQISTIALKQTNSIFTRLINGTNPDGTIKKRPSRSRISSIAIISSLILLLILTTRSKHSDLPGFSNRSGYSSSRRTDALLRKAQQQKAKSLSSSSSNLLQPDIANFTEPAPFTFCPTFGPNDELGQVYGRDAISKTRAHVGSSERVRKVIKRAMSGLPVTIGVLGGSISSCHGLQGTREHPMGDPIGKSCYPHRIFTWLNDVFPHPANELTNGARE